MTVKTYRMSELKTTFTNLILDRRTQQQKKNGLHKCYLAEGVSHNSDMLLLTQLYASFIFRITQIISEQNLFSDTKHSRIHGAHCISLLSQTYTQSE